MKNNNSILKWVIIIVFITTPIYANSQDFNGSYTSDFTSYQNIADSSLNFTERTRFNLFITDSAIVIQDIRIPKKLLFYFIPEAPVLFQGKYIYSNVISEYMNNETTCKIIIYRKEGVTNLMVYYETKTQMFFDLKIDESEEY